MTEFKPLSLDSVVAMDEPTPLSPNPMYKVENLTERVYRNLSLTHEDSKQAWLVDGIDCEVLTVGSSWKKGKVRIKIAVEFCEDSETSTDELSILRSQI